MPPLPPQVLRRFSSLPSSNLFLLPISSFFPTDERSSRASHSSFLLAFRPASATDTLHLFQSYPNKENRLPDTLLRRLNIACTTHRYILHNTNTTLQFTKLYHTVLHYTAIPYCTLYSAILCHTRPILRYTLLQYYTLLYYATLCYNLLYYRILCYALLCYTIQYHSMLF